MKHKVIAFSGGGTLGHIYPAIPVINYLKEKCPEIKIIYIASMRDKNYDILVIIRIIIDISTCGLWTIYYAFCLRQFEKTLLMLLIKNEE